MSSIRFIRFPVPLVAAVTVVALLGVGIALTARLALSGETPNAALAVFQSQPASVGAVRSSIPAEGLAIYRASERGLAAPGPLAKGWTIYRQSEVEATTPLFPSHEVGMQVFLQGERNLKAAGMSAEGWSIYRQSEVEATTALSPSHEAGMQIYRESEWAR